MKTKVDPTLTTEIKPPPKPPLKPTRKQLAQRSLSWTLRSALGSESNLNHCSRTPMSYQTQQQVKLCIKELGTLIKLLRADLSNL